MNGAPIDSTPSSSPSVPVAEKPATRDPSTLPKKGSRYGGTGLWSMYYVADVAFDDKNQNVKHTARLATGEKVTFYLSQEQSKSALMEASIRHTDRSGKVRVGTLVHGVWQELPEGAYGLGNRKNPLVPWVHVAADQSLYPFGSRVYLPEADGKTTPDGKVVDGHFWVGDTGSAIKGRLRFDLFVGDHKVFSEMMVRVKTIPHKFDCYVEPPPSVPKAIRPDNPLGMHELLKRLDCFKTPEAANAVPCPYFSKFSDEMKDALITFQKRYKDIPPAEYGCPFGAVTYWFLSVEGKNLTVKANK